MGSHSVTCHPTQVNTPRPNPNQTGRCSVKSALFSADVKATCVLHCVDQYWQRCHISISMNCIECIDIRRPPLLAHNALSARTSAQTCAVSSPSSISGTPTSHPLSIEVCYVFVGSMISNPPTISWFGKIYRMGQNVSLLIIPRTFVYCRPTFTTGTLRASAPCI